MSPVRTRVWDGSTWRGRSGAAPTPPQIAYDWSDTNLPWAYASQADFTARWPSVTIVPIQTASADFYTNLSNTVAAASGRVVVELGEGTYHLDQFRMAGTSGDPAYAFGFWFSKLQGLLGQGPDRTIIQMDADSMSAEQLAIISSWTIASGTTLSMALCRIDGQSGSPALLGGLTFQAADQQDVMLASDFSAIGSYEPQPAPHRGVQLYGAGMSAIVSHVRWRGAGRLINNGPPFECSNVISQRMNITYYNCESDGRRAPEIDPARPARCTVYMGNNETASTWVDSWMHHANLSRYAVNDQNSNTSGPYTLRRTKLDHIGNRNVDPAINGGDSLGGGTTTVPMGWEDCNSLITLEDCILWQDNVPQSTQKPAHLQFTTVGARNPQGGRLVVTGTQFRNSGVPSLDGWAIARTGSTTYWHTDTEEVTLAIHHPTSGARLSPWRYTGTWPPTDAQMAAAGVSSDTHYILT